MPAPRILGVATALPGPGESQQTIVETLGRLWSDRPVDRTRLERIHRATRVERRHFALPLARRAALPSFADRNRGWQEAAGALAERALVDALARANVSPRELGHLVLVTSTGIALPGLDVRLANRLRLDGTLVRWPLAGFGCLGGGAALARAASVLRGDPRSFAAVVAVELFSYAVQLDDVSDANLVATGLFGDGAAAVVLAGAEARRAGPKVLATRSALVPDSEWVMGWDVRDTGFGVVLSPRVPDFTRENVCGPVDALLASEGARRRDVRHWIAHPGGPKVLAALQEALSLPEGALALSARSLAEGGNMSAVSVLDVLARTLDDGAPRSGDLGMLLALGPGFAAELALIGF